MLYEGHEVKETQERYQNGSASVKIWVWNLRAVRKKKKEKSKNGVREIVCYEGHNVFIKDADNSESS